jgi:hypothetical protein
MNIRIDFVFSYWLFCWWVLYHIKIIKSSPKFGLILGLIDNIIMIYFMFLYKTKYQTIINFIIINTIIKVIPLYLMRTEEIITNDIINNFLLFLFFISWININNQNLSNNIKIIYDSIINNRNTMPLMAILNDLENYIFNYNLSI